MTPVIQNVFAVILLSMICLGIPTVLVLLLGTMQYCKNQEMIKRIRDTKRVINIREDKNVSGRNS